MMPMPRDWDRDFSHNKCPEDNSKPKSLKVLRRAERRLRNKLLKAAAHIDARDACERRIRLLHGKLDDFRLEPPKHGAVDLVNEFLQAMDRLPGMSKS